MSNLYITGDRDGKLHLRKRFVDIIAFFEKIQEQKVAAILSDYYGKRVGWFKRRTLTTNEEIIEWIKTRSTWAARDNYWTAKRLFEWEIRRCQDTIRILDVAIKDGIDIIFDTQASTILGNYNSGVYEKYSNDA